MKELKVRFVLHHQSFTHLEELNPTARSTFVHDFVSWEKKVRACAISHSLNEELNMDATKMVNITINTHKRESIL